MNDLATLCCLVLYWTSGVSALPRAEKNGLPPSNEEHVITQSTNNFEYISDSKKQFLQRCITNDTHFKKENGIVILIIGEQKKMDTYELKKEVWKQYAKEFNALLIHVENRFWGSSSPWKSFTNEHLVYLNSEQVLADYAMFIDAFKRKYSGLPKTAKWIAFGSGRSGTLAARLRLKYPHLVKAAVSESGPLWEVSNYNEFFAKFDQGFGQKCLDKINKAYKLLISALYDLKKKMKLKGKFKLCHALDFSNKENKNRQYFIWTIFTFLGVLIEKSYDKNVNELKNKVMNQMCHSSFHDELDRLASSIDLILKYYQETKKYQLSFRIESKQISGSIEKRTKIPCLSVNYIDAVRMYQDTSDNANQNLHLQLIVGFGDRQSFYQRCTEFGQFRTSDFEENPFGSRITLDFYTEFCIDVFGNGFELINYAVERSQMFYGGRDIQVKHVIFVNRGSDPSSILNIPQSTTSEVAVYIEEDNDKVKSKKNANQAVENSLFYSQRENIMNKLREWLLFTDEVEVEIVD